MAKLLECQACHKLIESMDWHGESEFLGLLVCKRCFRNQEYEDRSFHCVRRPASTTRYYYEVPIISKFVKGEGMKYMAKIARNIPYLALEYKMDEGVVIIEVGSMGHHYLQRLNYAKLIEREIK